MLVQHRAMNVRCIELQHFSSYVTENVTRVEKSNCEV